VTSEQTLQDDILGLKAQLSGKRLELSMARGKRSQAAHYQRQMYSAIRARRELRLASSEQAGECFFDVAGQVDRAALEGCELISGAARVAPKKAVIRPALPMSFCAGHYGDANDEHRAN